MGIIRDLINKRARIDVFQLHLNLCGIVFVAFRALKCLYLSEFMSLLLGAYWLLGIVMQSKPTNLFRKKGRARNDEGALVEGNCVK